MAQRLRQSHRAAQGKVHDLYAKAAAFEDKKGTRLVIVTLTGTLQKLSGPLDVQFGMATLDLEQLPSVERLLKDARSAPKTVEAQKAAYLLDKIEHGVEVPLTQNCPPHVVRFGKEFAADFYQRRDGRRLFGALQT